MNVLGVEPSPLLLSPESSRRVFRNVCCSRAKGKCSVGIRKYGGACSGSKGQKVSCLALWHSLALWVAWPWPASFFSGVGESERERVGSCEQGKTTGGSSDEARNRDQASRPTPYRPTLHRKLSLSFALVVFFVVLKEEANKNMYVPLLPLYETITSD